MAGDRFASFCSDHKTISLISGYAARGAVDRISLLSCHR
jgi:hypothetical protein